MAKYGNIDKSINDDIKFGIDATDQYPELVKSLTKQYEAAFEHDKSVFKETYRLVGNKVLDKAKKEGTIK